MWAVRSVSGKKLEEVGRLQELMRGQKEMGLVVEVMAVGSEMNNPAVVFQQLFEEFSINFQLLTRGLGEVEPGDFNNLGDLVGSLGAVEKMLQIIREKAEQADCDTLMETAWATLCDITQGSPLHCESFLAAGGMFLFLRCKVRL